MTNEIKGGDKSASGVEVATSLLTAHKKQGEYSPEMSKKKWAGFLASVKKKGILKPIYATKGFRVIDGKSRLQAAKQLGIESMQVVIVDIPENDIPEWIAETKLNKDELKPGQKAAIVIRLFYEELAQKAKANSLANLKQNTEMPDLANRSISRDTAKMLADKAGIGRSSMTYLIAVYRNRLDLFERVFNGEYSINKAYTEMKSDEEPKVVKPEETPIEIERKAIEARREAEASLPQIDERQPTHSLDNRLVQMRKNALPLTIEVLDESDKINEAKPEVKDSARSQLLALARSCVLALGQTSEDEEDAELLAVVHELLNKLNGGN